MSPEGINTSWRSGSPVVLTLLVGGVWFIEFLSGSWISDASGLRVLVLSHSKVKFVGKG